MFTDNTFGHNLNEFWDIDFCNLEILTQYKLKSNVKSAEVNATK